MEVGQKFLYDIDTAMSIPWLKAAIESGENRYYVHVPLRQSVCFDIFVVFKVAAGTRIRLPYVLDPDIDPDGYLIARTDDYSSVDVPELDIVSARYTDKYHSPALAQDLSQAEQCGVLLVAARQRTGDVCLYDEVRQLVFAILEDMPVCPYYDYELLTDWIEKAEKANYALSCVQDLAEYGKLYEAAWATAPYNTHTLKSVINVWKREMSKERASAVDVSGLIASNNPLI